MTSRKNHEGGPTPGTPLPWPQPRLSLSGLNWLVSEMPPIAGARLEADARYIVHACNCFPELLEALEEAIETSDRLCAERGWVRAPEAEATLTKMRAAIAKARAQEQSA